MKERSTSTDFLLFYVNGKEIIERHAEPEWTLLWYLRNSKYLSTYSLRILMSVFYFRTEINWFEIGLR